MAHFNLAWTVAESYKLKTQRCRSTWPMWVDQFVIHPCDGSTARQVMWLLTVFFAIWDFKPVPSRELAKA